MKSKVNLWLIRFYTLAIAVVYLGELLEGGALNLVITLATVLILIQSFFVETRSQHPGSEKSKNNE